MNSQEKSGGNSLRRSSDTQECSANGRKRHTYLPFCSQYIAHVQKAANRIFQNTDHFGLLYVYSCDHSYRVHSTNLASIIGPSLPETANEDSIREFRSIRVSATEAHTTRHDTTDCRHWILSSTACDISISTFAELHFILRIFFTYCFRFKPAHSVSLPPYMAIRDSLSGTVVKLRTGRQQNSGSIPGRSVRFSILGILHTGCVGQPASTLMDTGILCPG
jgi:hypothetical protein